MNTETKKIGMACFIGGFICASVALAVNPGFWWMGMLAGFAGGYLAYEFRSVLRAAPVAWKSAKKGGGVVLQRITNLLRELIFEKHPVWHPFIMVCCYFGYEVLPFTISRLASNYSHILEFVFLAIIMTLGTVVMLCFVTDLLMKILFGFLIEIGAENENWKVNFLEEEIYDKSNGFSRAINYSDLLCWWGKGLFLVIKWIICFLAWKMWCWSAIGIYLAICFFARFLKNLFILIHSNKRLLCGIDGSIGGAVAYIWLASPTMNILSKTLLCVFGGLIGAGFGILNHEVISKRVLRLPVNGA